MFYSYFYKISFRILKNHRFYKKTGASWFYYHSHSCTTFNLCISSACLRPNLMPLRENKTEAFLRFLIDLLHYSLQAHCKPHSTRILSICSQIESEGFSL